MSEVTLLPPRRMLGKFNILIVGNKGVGKSSYVRRLLGYPWRDNYTHCELSSHILPTNNGNIRFDICETENPDIISSDCDAMIFLTNCSDNFKHDITKYKVPVIMCITMADISKSIPYSTPLTNTIFCISAKEKIDLYDPFVFLAKQLLKDDDLLHVPDNKSLSSLLYKARDTEEIKDNRAIENSGDRTSKAMAIGIKLYKDINVLIGQYALNSELFSSFNYDKDTRTHKFNSPDGFSFEIKLNIKVD